MEMCPGYASGVVKCSHQGIRHQSPAIRHVLKIKLGDIAICSSVIPKNYEDWYRALYVRNTEQMVSKKHSHTQIDDALAMK